MVENTDYNHPVGNFLLYGLLENENYTISLRQYTVNGGYSDIVSFNFTTSSNKIDMCNKKTKSMSMVCSDVKYNKLNTGGNDPTLSKKMQYAQYIRSSKSKTTFFR